MAATPQRGSFAPLSRFGPHCRPSAGNASLVRPAIYGVVKFPTELSVLILRTEGNLCSVTANAQLSPPCENDPHARNVRGCKHTLEASVSPSRIFARLNMSG